MTAAATAIGDDTMAIAVVDRGGRILGVYARSAPMRSRPTPRSPPLARRRNFSNANAPLSSRTVRFISGIHFPPGVPNTAERRAVRHREHESRLPARCARTLGPFDRPQSIAGSGLAGAAAGVQSVRHARLRDRQSDCADQPRGSTRHVGFSTGKNDVLDTGAPLDVPVNPGGFALYRNGRVIGGVGVAGVTVDRAEYAAFVGADRHREPASRRCPPTHCLCRARYSSTASASRSSPRASACSACWIRSRRPPARAPRGRFHAGGRACRAARRRQPVPEGYLIGPVGQHASPAA